VTPVWDRRFRLSPAHLTKANLPPPPPARLPSHPRVSQPEGAGGGLIGEAIHDQKGSACRAALGRHTRLGQATAGEGACQPPGQEHKGLRWLPVGKISAAVEHFQWADRRNRLSHEALSRQSGSGPRSSIFSANVETPGTGTQRVPSLSAAKAPLPASLRSRALAYAKRSGRRLKYHHGKSVIGR